ncbi:MAG: aminoacetone oxidase family FAD-binding enzyme [Lachnospiraceae bacterium]|nr:aminoacetone oxidase family FAD-binding enzyme [Lachnospiraceae bacterium]
MGRVAVIGGGAAGMMAAVAAARSGAQVTVFEKNDRVGKKILATGNGKCNFSNRDFSVEYYHGDQRRLKGYFDRFSMEDTVRFFEAAGMLVKDKQGYLYPWSEQASTLLDLLRLELAGQQVEILLSTEVKEISRSPETGRFRVCPGRDQGEYEAVIIACGGCAAPRTGSDGSGYLLAKALGHRIVPVVPALVQLRCSDGFFQSIAGVRCEAVLRLCTEEEARHRVLQEERGELQFTDYGISGIPVFQLSRTAACHLKRKERVTVYIDLLPQMERQDFEAFCARRLHQGRDRTIEEFLLGMANKKLNLLMLRQAGLKPSETVERAGIRRMKKLLYSYRELQVHVSAANSFENAQVTAGGVDLSEIGKNLDSMKMPGIYFAGEVLDVDGRCGGYNLQWAWTSGWIAGQSAALRKARKH